MNDLEKILLETANELGCEPDNEEILSAINDLKQRTKQAGRERDAAISKVMRVIGAATTLMMAKDEEMADIATRDLENVLREQSTESHRRLKAQWQAEAVAELICEFIPWEVDGDVKAFMRQRRDELRAQANEV